MMHVISQIMLTLIITSKVIKSIALAQVPYPILSYTSHGWADTDHVKVSELSHSQY